MAKSRVFKAGQKLYGTMLTIIDQSNGSCMDFEVLCECGRKFTASYQQLYYGRYSCGCKRRVRSNAVDYTGFTATNKNGNGGYGRTVRVLDRAEDSSWLYICECCAEIFKVPRGLERGGLARGLRDLAGYNCPNFQEYRPIERMEPLVAMIGDTRVLGRPQKAEILSQYYPPERVKRDRFGDIEGFYGNPIVPKILPVPAKNRPVEEDPDGFEV